MTEAAAATQTELETILGYVVRIHEWCGNLDEASGKPCRSRADFRLSGETVTCHNCRQPIPDDGFGDYCDGCKMYQRAKALLGIEEEE